MAKILSMELALRVWNAHREIQVATKLRDDMKKSIAKGEPITPLDSFGRRQGLRLGVPSGENCHQLFDVDPSIAIDVINAHITAKEKELVEASAAAAKSLKEKQ